MEDKKNNLDKVPIANLERQELKKVKELEQKFDDKYYLIAFKKDQDNQLKS